MTIYRVKIVPHRHPICLRVVFPRWIFCTFVAAAVSAALGPAGAAGSAAAGASGGSATSVRRAVETLYMYV